MTREDREACWSSWKEAKELLRLRRDEFYADVRARQIGRWRDWVKQNETRFETLQAEIDRCEDLERNARTEEFAERMRARIEAKLQKISELESRNAELELKIAEAENRASCQ